MSAAESHAEIDDALEQIRRAIASLRINARSKAHPMTCTVSVGWATARDAETLKTELTGRSLRGALETVVAEAKRTRDVVLRYDPAMEKRGARDGRADCGGCLAKFTLSIAIDDPRGDALHCPNCGARVERPVSLRPGG